MSLNSRLIPTTLDNAESHKKITAPQKTPSLKNAQGIANSSTSTSTLEQTGGAA